MIHCHSCTKESPEVKRYYYLEADLCDACFDKYVKNPKEKYSKTLRDEFAMAALIPLVGVSLDESGDDGYRHKVLIRNIGKAYLIADAMLEARKAKGE